MSNSDSLLVHGRTTILSGHVGHVNSQRTDDATKNRVWQHTAHEWRFLGSQLKNEHLQERQDKMSRRTEFRTVFTFRASKFLAEGILAFYQF